MSDTLPRYVSYHCFFLPYGTEEVAINVHTT